jgi:hypothetical protein
VGFRPQASPDKIGAGAQDTVFRESLSSSRGESHDALDRYRRYCALQGAPHPRGPFWSDRWQFIPSGVVTVSGPNGFSIGSSVNSSTGLTLRLSSLSKRLEDRSLLGLWKLLCRFQVPCGRVLGVHRDGSVNNGFVSSKFRERDFNGRSTFRGPAGLNVPRGTPGVEKGWARPYPRFLSSTSATYSRFDTGKIPDTRDVVLHNLRAGRAGDQPTHGR